MDNNPHISNIDNLNKIPHYRQRITAESVKDISSLEMISSLHSIRI